VVCSIEPPVPLVTAGNPACLATPALVWDRDLLATSTDASTAFRNLNTTLFGPLAAQLTSGCEKFEGRDLSFFYSASKPIGGIIGREWSRIGKLNSLTSFFINSTVSASHDADLSIFACAV